MIARVDAACAGPRCAAAWPRLPVFC